LLQLCALKGPEKVNIDTAMRKPTRRRVGITRRQGRFRSLYDLKQTRFSTILFLTVVVKLRSLFPWALTPRAGLSADSAARTAPLTPWVHSGRVHTLGTRPYCLHLLDEDRWRQLVDWADSFALRRSCMHKGTLRQSRGDAFCLHTLILQLLFYRWPTTDTHRSLGEER